MRQVELRKFAAYPFGRYRDNGPYSAQAFREDVLEPALRMDDDVVEVVLDGARGLGSSFLEETFGGLIRDGWPVGTVADRLRIISQVDPTLIREAMGYIEAAAKEVAGRNRLRA